MRARYHRLSPLDRMLLSIEGARTPTHIGALLLLEGPPLLDAAGHLRLEEIRLRLERRLRRVPVLRKVLYRPGPLLGPPLWVDDAAFSVERHILHGEIPAPGGEAQLLRLVEKLLSKRLDRFKPLWELWFLTGLESGRLAVLVKLHHSIADGKAALRIFSALFDLTPDAADPGEEPWSPRPPPSHWQLFVDNLAVKGAALARAVKRLAHPVALARSAASAGRTLVRTLRENQRAPRTSLNAPVEVGRRLSVMRMGLTEARNVAHARGVRINDVMLALIAGGSRELLLHRGEPVEGVALMASVAVSLRLATDAGDLGNKTAQLLAPLPLDLPDPEACLEAIAASTRKMKKKELATSFEHIIAWVSRSGLLRFLARRQHMMNLFESDLEGPPVPLFVLGARILDVTIANNPAGTVGLTFAILSYAGQLNLSVCADAERFPDLEVLVAGMERNWAQLLEGLQPGEQVSVHSEAVW
ncbi:wax ester/triacylglycerol synthase family O-acyltransferase [Vitiosangium sp. GDMCC 1.1324]|uniref:wax ester/triacylglycerol synthase family O-acyltransferase n=1 Tax=Vitiosangium sp. (strain GDMCC 1.1324) TaxID=2138576 RepID=UPI000D358D9E|nr:wax ester/triacylglycerol synthase family O-acyltransferase [Vitiosangium sp. GDMCC 1.1324]PTL82475.1 wax ester/triacylglycerol synthase family O-acyltransferase [Vitiosangium sp. GDMCC 1.1324]